MQRGEAERRQVASQYSRPTARTTPQPLDQPPVAAMLAPLQHRSAQSQPVIAQIQQLGLKHHPRSRVRRQEVQDTNR